MPVAECVRDFAARVEGTQEGYFDELASRGHAHPHIRAAVRAPLEMLQGQRIHAINSVSTVLRCKATEGMFQHLDQRFLHTVSSTPEDDRGTQVLMHRTSVEAGRAILSSRYMRPGREGTLGAGIYFAETEEACAKKAQLIGCGNEYAIVKASVQLGRCRVVEHGELEWRMITDGGFDKADLEELGFSSVATNFHGGWEYCVVDPDRVTVMDVSFHKTDRLIDKIQKWMSPTPSDLAPLPGVAKTCMWSAHNGAWEEYTPSLNTLVVIGPGAGLRKNHHVYKRLEELGYTIVPIWGNGYDHTPPGTQVLAPLGFGGFAMPNLGYNRTRNLATLAKEVICPTIQGLIDEGRGPIAVIAASRGGTISIPALWEFWRGPTLVGNAGFLTTAIIPAQVHCVLMTGGRDSFVTRNRKRTRRLIQKEDPSAPVLNYHDPKDKHEFPRLTGNVIEKLIKLASVDVLHTETKGPWPRRCRLELI